MPDVRPKIHRPTTSPIKSRLKSVLGVRSSYVECNYSLHVVFILHQLAVPFAFETGNGCSSSKTFIQTLNHLLLFKDYFLSAITVFNIFILNNNYCCC